MLFDKSYPPWFLRKAYRRIRARDSSWRLPSHVLDSVLITEPVTALDSVVEVPSPVVLVHVSKGRVDTSLGCDCVRSGWEQLGNAGCFVTRLGESESCPEAGTSSSDYDCIVLVVDNGVVS